MSAPWTGPDLVHTTSTGTEIYVEKGGKSQFNFKVRYKEPRKRRRTPRHIHLIIDLYMKKARNQNLTMQLVQHLIDNVISKVQPSKSNPPRLQIFSPTHVQKFQDLNNCGEYPVEFLLVVAELIAIQEKTNYPSGKMTECLFRSFLDEKDIFSVVGAATYRGRR